MKDGVRSFNVMSQHLKESKFKGMYRVTRKYNGVGVLWDGGFSLGACTINYPFCRPGHDDVSTGLWNIGRDGYLTPMINVPPFILDVLPRSVSLQGELWIDDDLQLAMSITSTQKGQNWARWNKLKFVVYNYKPLSTWGYKTKLNNLFFPNVPFADRWNNIEMYLKGEYLHPLGKAIPKTDFIIPAELLGHCDKWEDIKQYQELSASKNWEGLMFQEINALYENDRSWSLMKWKPDYDYEATITGFIDGKTGKNIGKTGAISARLTWDNQIESIHGGTPEMIGKSIDFTISGLNDKEREENYFHIGQSITIKFKFVSIYGLPQQCSIKRD